MSKKVGFVYSPAYEEYSFGPDHPFNSKRMVLTLDLLIKAGILSRQELIPPPTATGQDLLLAHDLQYIETVQRLSAKGSEPNLTYGLGSEDTPVFPHMHEVTSLVTGGTLHAAKLVMEGKVEHALNLGGGLHHAMRDKAAGFCIYNDAVVAISYIKEHFGARVAYVDLDAHHGDGVQAAFYSDPNVLTISIHETGRYLFPGTGFVEERGIGEGFSYSVNLPMEAFTEDDSWIRSFGALVPPLIESFKPDIIISQNGCDAHSWDPLTHMCLTTRSYSVAFRLLHKLAHRVCQGRLVALGGGGYDWFRVVPRVWSLLWSELAERPLPEEIPDPWLKNWEPAAQVKLPDRFADNPYLFDPIPRRAEIEEKNSMMVQRVLNAVTYQMHKFV